MWKKNYYKRLIIGSVLFGIIVFGDEVYNGTWNWSGFLWVAYGAVGYAVLYHILFARFIAKDDSEKNS